MPPRGRTPIVTSPNLSAPSNSHPASLTNFPQPPRSILKKPSLHENPTSDLLYMPPSELPGLNEQRSRMKFTAPIPPPAAAAASRASTSPGMYDENDDDSSPQVF